MARFNIFDPDRVCFILISFEGPDLYSLAGGLGTRMRELSWSLAMKGFETHLFFIGDPDLPGEEKLLGGRLTLHRWCQWISRYHPQGVYDGEEGKIADFSRSLPPFVVDQIVVPCLKQKRYPIILAEEWHTVWATMSLSDLLHARGLRQQTLIFWNANNTMGFEKIPWGRLAYTAYLTTVSRFMKQKMWAWGVNPVVIPNGVPDRLFQPLEADPQALRRVFGDRLLLVKVARFDPDKRWLQAIHSVALLKREGIPVAFLMRGGIEPHGAEVLWTAHQLGLQVAEVHCPGQPSFEEALETIAQYREAEVLNLRFYIPEALLRLLYKTADAVLANSGFEPFGLVGLETMAEGGIAFTGATGEDYARPYENALCIETEDPKEIVANLLQLRASPDLAEKIRQEARHTAESYRWSRVVDLLCRRIEAMAYRQGLEIED